MTAALLHGLVLAFGLILPLGAQNIFVFNQGAVQSRYRLAVPVIITAALCDTLLIILAIVGVSVIVLKLPVLQIVLFSGGLCFLIYMGWSIWNSGQAFQKEKARAMSAKKQILFALSVSLLNPHAILDTVGVIGTSSLHYMGVEKVIFAIACIMTSWLWFFGLAFVGKKVGALDQTGKYLVLVNRVSAIMIFGVAIYLAFQLFHLTT